MGKRWSKVAKNWEVKDHIIWLKIDTRQYLVDKRGEIPLFITRVSFEVIFTRRK
jgi:hypothetical protein